MRDSFILTDNERSEIGALAETLANTAPQLVNDPRWISAGRSLSCQIPLRLRDRLRAFRYDSGTDGMLLLRRLPFDEEQLPLTPQTSGAAERNATQCSSLIALISLQIGEIVAYRSEKSGVLVQNVVPIPGQEHQQGNEGSSSTLGLHNENAFHPFPPDFVALFCLRPDHDEEAGLTTASIRRTIDQLSNTTRQTLREPRFSTAPPASFGARGATGSVHSVLNGNLKDPSICVDLSNTKPLDAKAKVALDELEAMLSSEAATVKLKSGDLALVDNRIVLHGRTDFTPRYDGKDRWLHRTFIQLDRRRSLEAQTESEYVLM